MDVLGIIVLTALFTWWTKTTLFPPPKKEKSAEEKLGEAIGKFLEKGIKINVVTKEK
jgi:hypothetical protein